MKTKENIIKNIQNDLMYYIESGKKTTPLKKKLMDEYSLSYEDADTIVRTEIARIETIEAAKRYINHGGKYYRFIGGEADDEKSCETCKKLNGKKFLLSKIKIGVNAPPIHDGCRCCIAPVVK